MRTLIKRTAVVLCAVLAAGCTTEKALESDKPLVVTIDDLGEFGFERSELTGEETFNRVKYVDGSLQVEYGFETPDSSAEALSINVTAGFHKTPKDAVDSYRMEKGGAAIGIGAVSGVSLKEMPGFYTWGDESYFAQLIGPTGQPGGMVFATRRGTRTYLFMAGGMYFDDPREWAALIEPRLKYLESYDPTKAKS
jgi:hypothetical protein